MKAREWKSYEECIKDDTSNYKGVDLKTIYSYPITEGRHMTR